MPVDSGVPNPANHSAPCLHDANDAGKASRRCRRLSAAADSHVRSGKADGRVARRAFLRATRSAPIPRRRYRRPRRAGCGCRNQILAFPQTSLPSSPSRRRCSIARLKALPEIGIFAAQVDKPVPRPERITGDRHPVENDVGNFRQKYAIFEGARLAFVGVADDVVRFADRLSAEPPLQPRRKPRAAAASELGFGHDLNDVFGSVSEGRSKATGQRRPRLKKTGPDFTRLALILAFGSPAP